MIRALLPALFMIGCGIPEDDFAAIAADSLCDRVEECEGEFDDNGRANCEAFWTGAAELLVDLGDLVGETYSPSAGRTCVSELRSATCGELNDFEIDCDVFEP
ncbi:MAG: hypothetical protein AAGA48_00950 [Myxococcota bacterium]